MVMPFAGLPAELLVSKVVESRLPLRLSVLPKQLRLLPPNLVFVKLKFGSRVLDRVEKVRSQPWPLRGSRSKPSKMLPLCPITAAVRPKSDAFDPLTTNFLLPPAMIPLKGHPGLFGTDDMSYGILIICQAFDVNRTMRINGSRLFCVLHTAICSRRGQWDDILDRFVDSVGVKV